MKRFTPGEAQRSGPHRRVEGFLETMGLNYTSERYFPPYTVDIYMSEFHIALEIDGPFHSPPKDRARDKYLRETYGLIIMRIDGKKYIKEDKTKQAIIEFLENNTSDVDERMELCRTQL